MTEYSYNISQKNFLVSRDDIVCARDSHESLVYSQLTIDRPRELDADNRLRLRQGRPASILTRRHARISRRVNNNSHSRELSAVPMPRRGNGSSKQEIKPDSHLIAFSVLHCAIRSHE